MSPVLIKEVWALLLSVWFVERACSAFAEAIIIESPTFNEEVSLTKEYVWDAGVTVTAHVAVWPPSTVVTVILAEPSPTAVTKPLETVATVVLSEDQVTSFLDAFTGKTVSVNCW